MIDDSRGWLQRTVALTEPNRTGTVSLHECVTSNCAYGVGSDKLLWVDPLRSLVTKLNLFRSQAASSLLNSFVVVFLNIRLAHKPYSFPRSFIKGIGDTANFVFPYTAAR